MRVPISWLREYAPIPEPYDALEVGRRLTLAGLEVETVEQVGHDVRGVITAQVMSIEELAGYKKPIRYCRVATSDAELAAEPETLTGVICGATLTCPVGQDCCVSFANNMATGQTCVASASQCQGAALACDGPEDCNMSTTDACCATVMTKGAGTDAGPMVTGGNSKCGQCSASYSPASGTLMTRLCHGAADCKNFGISFGGQMIAFDSCCSNGTAGSVQFCAPALIGQGGGFTCQ